MKFFALIIFSYIGVIGCGPSYIPNSLSESDSTSFASFEQFPTNPSQELTPGSLCQRPDAYRYPEHIKYCERDVSSRDKARIIESYDEALGFNIRSLKRSDFKIDHYISLCIGGSNSSNNLWPQHRSVYELTDPIESKLCVLLQRGTISQQYAVDTLKHVKNNLDDALRVDEELDDEI